MDQISFFMFIQTPSSLFPSPTASKDILHYTQNAQNSAKIHSVKQQSRTLKPNLITSQPHYRILSAE